MLEETLGGNFGDDYGLLIKEAILEKLDDNLVRCLAATFQHTSVCDWSCK